MRALFRLSRMAALPVPALLVVWAVAANDGPTNLVLKTGTLAIWPLTLLVASALGVRCLEARRLDHLDLLTGSGRALAWSAAAVVIASVRIGWASLAVVGLLGLAVVHLTALWTCLFAAGPEPLARATVERCFEPAVPVEGDRVCERIRLEGARIPPGCRLFVCAQLERGPESRYVVEAEASGAEVLLGGDLGPAVRGQLVAPPVSLWLGDVLGLCRAPRIERGEARLLVLPRPALVESVDPLVGRSGPGDDSRPTDRLPSEGSFRLRPYVEGEDARRIHWLRSLAQGRLIVRLPDEIPDGRARVRLLLDCFLLGADGLTCRAHQELLDALVSVWLGVGRALAERGFEVTVGTAAPDLVERPLGAQWAREALRLGAQVRWQDSLPVGDLVGRPRPGCRTIVVSCRPRQLDDGPQPEWILVPAALWTRPEAPSARVSWGVLPFPTGCEENRFTRRRRQRQRVARAHEHRALVEMLLRSVARPPRDRVLRACRDRAGVRLEVAR